MTNNTSYSHFKLKNDSRYRNKYPINTTYTPVSIDYYWTIVKRIIKGKRGN